MSMGSFPLRTGEYVDTRDTPTKGLPFFCPLCDHTVSETVTGGVIDGKTVVTALTRCMQCKFGFLDPTRYVVPRARVGPRMGAQSVATPAAQRQNQLPISPDLLAKGSFWICLSCNYANLIFG